MKHQKQNQRVTVSTTIKSSQSSRYQQLTQFIDKIFKQKISNDERLDRLGEVEFDMTPYTYGEIGFGKPCVAAALTLSHYLKKCIGIEYLEGLFQKSLEVKSEYEKLGLDNLPELEFKQDDFLINSDWAFDADVVFANATCFEPEMVAQISKILSEKLKSGGIVIMTTKSLVDEGDLFKKIGPFKKKMSWGSASVTVYIKN
ncbi:dot1 domain containing protein [Stylonychia lemnae]|uniref:Dot1 domain containing protein n=1 Tax=Stylonychia lemnae TaxID=5949 RepID=A0A078BCX4_STYLE|nr:dot1 domain containing protein [Stylonychia lemnae]|eukprot:CDW91443.1 dot1 domain containing protein [Stylonychia lemnae]